MTGDFDMLLLADDPAALFAPCYRLKASLCEVAPGLLPAGAAPEWLLVQAQKQAGAAGALLTYRADAAPHFLVRFATSDDHNLDHYGHVVGWGADIGTMGRLTLEQCTLINLN